MQSAARLCEADIGTITRQKDSVYFRAALYGFPPEFADRMSRVPVELNRGTVTGRALIEGSVVHVEDVTADTEYEWAEAQQAGQFRTLLGVPLLRHGTPIGAMALGRRAVHPFTERQIQLVRTFADQAVIAIENVRLFEEVQARTRELQEALEYQTATSEVLSVISRAPSQMEPVFEAIVQTAARLCHADSAIVCTRGEDELYHFSAVSGHSEEMRAVVHKRPIAADRGSVSGRAVLERRAVQIRDALADPEFTRFDTQAAGQFRTLLGVPLLREGTPIGVISMQRRRVEPFTEKQIDLVTTFADQAVIAIENTRLFEEVQARTAELSEALEQQTATSDVLGVISRSLGQLEPVFQSMLANAMRICDAKCGVMFSHSNDAFRAIPAWGWTRHLRSFCAKSVFGVPTPAWAESHGPSSRSMLSIRLPMAPTSTEIEAA